MRKDAPSHLTPEEVWEQLCVHEPGGSAFLPHNQLRYALQLLDYNPGQDEVGQLLRQSARGNEDGVAFQDFMRCCEILQATHYSDGDIQSACAALGDGAMNRAEFRKVIEKQRCVSEAEIDGILLLTDKCKEGKITPDHLASCLIDCRRSEREGSRTPSIPSSVPPAAPHPERPRSAPTAAASPASACATQSPPPIPAHIPRSSVQSERGHVSQYLVGARRRISGVAALEESSPLRLSGLSVLQRARTYSGMSRGRAELRVAASNATTLRTAAGPPRQRAPHAEASTVHGGCLRPGAWVRVTGLRENVDFNGMLGRVLVLYEDGEVAVVFPLPYGARAVQPERLVPALAPLDCGPWDEAEQALRRAVEPSPSPKSVPVTGPPPQIKDVPVTIESQPSAGDIGDDTVPIGGGNHTEEHAKPRSPDVSPCRRRGSRQLCTPPCTPDPPSRAPLGQRACGASAGTRYRGAPRGKEIPVHAAAAGRRSTSSWAECGGRWHEVTTKGKYNWVTAGVLPEDYDDNREYWDALPAVVCVAVHVPEATSACEVAVYLNDGGLDVYYNGDEFRLVFRVPVDGQLTPSALQAMFSESEQILKLVLPVQLSAALGESPEEPGAAQPNGPPSPRVAVIPTPVFRTRDARTPRSVGATNPPGGSGRARTPTRSGSSGGLNSNQRPRAATVGRPPTSPRPFGGGQVRPASSGLSTGQWVETVGLSDQPDINGQRGLLTDVCGTHAVVHLSGGAVKVLRSFLRDASPQQGMRVELAPFHQTAERGTVQRAVEMAAGPQCWEVLCDRGDVRIVAADRMRPVPRGSSHAQPKQLRLHCTVYPTAEGLWVQPDQDSVNNGMPMWVHTGDEYGQLYSDNEGYWVVAVCGPQQGSPTHAAQAVLQARVPHDGRQPHELPADQWEYRGANEWLSATAVWTVEPRGRSDASPSPDGSDVIIRGPGVPTAELPTSCRASGCGKSVLSRRTEGQASAAATTPTSTAVPTVAVGASVPSCSPGSRSREGPSPSSGSAPDAASTGLAAPEQPAVHLSDDSAVQVLSEQTSSNGEHDDAGEEVDALLRRGGSPGLAATQDVFAVPADPLPHPSAMGSNHLNVSDPNQNPLVPGGRKPRRASIIDSRAAAILQALQGKWIIEDEGITVACVLDKQVFISGADGKPLPDAVPIPLEVTPPQGPSAEQGIALMGAAVAWESSTSTRICWDDGDVWTKAPFYGGYEEQLAALQGGWRLPPDPADDSGLCGAVLVKDTVVEVRMYQPGRSVAERVAQVDLDGKLQNRVLLTDTAIDPARSTWDTVVWADGDKWERLDSKVGVPEAPAVPFAPQALTAVQDGPDNGSGLSSQEIREATIARSPNREPRHLQQQQPTDGADTLSSDTGVKGSQQGTDDRQRSSYTQPADGTVHRDSLPGEGDEARTQLQQSQRGHPSKRQKQGGCCVLS
eukprot:TRINITY_DN9406_c0_g1_i1.p1 TRINITY_DN9406_c0_g1~~TRINITY_DN9406_c0_g1_i1.p1  ORF type:complete len:1435 (+),score=169.97 TRINITY_DN9406_c0_g1_i1:157-4461(+)